MGDLGRFTVHLQNNELLCTRVLVIWRRFVSQYVFIYVFIYLLHINDIL